MDIIIFANPYAGNALANRLNNKQFTIVTDINCYDEIINNINLPTHIITAGGDGTAHLIINKLFATNKLSLIKYSILPFGTGNDLAHFIGFTAHDTSWLTNTHFTEITLPLWQMTRTTAQKVERHVFVNFIGVGIDAKVVHRAERLRSWRNRIYTQLMYALAGLPYITYRLPKNTRINLDQKTIKCNAGIILANINSYAGGCKLGDYKNNIVNQLNIFKLQSWFSLANIILTRIFKNHVRQPDANAKIVEISGNNLPIEMDGEFLPATTETATIRIEQAQQKLTFWVPARA